MGWRAGKITEWGQFFAYLCIMVFIFRMVPITDIHFTKHTLIALIILPSYP